MSTSFMHTIENLHVCIWLFKNAAIVKSLNGSSDSVTNSVNINHIPTLYGRLIESIEISELIEQVEQC